MNQSEPVGCSIRTNPPLWRHPYAPIVALLLIGIIPRVLLSFSSFALTWADSWAYSKWAYNIATRGDFTPYPVYRTPGYPVFLSIFYLLFGPVPPVGEIIVFAQRLLGLGTGITVYLIGLRAFSDRRVAFIGAAAFLLLPRVLYYETTILTESLFTFLLAISVLMAATILARPKDSPPETGSLILLALALALLTLTRPLGQFLAPIFAVLFILRFGKKLLVPSAILVLSFVVFILPWVVVNKKFSGFIGISKDQGLNFYHKVIDIDKSTPVDPSVTAYPQVHALYRKAKERPGVTYFHVYHGLLRARVRPARADSMMGGFALETFYQNKVRYVTNSAKLFGQFFFKTRLSVLRCQEADQPPFICSNLQSKGRLSAFPNFPNQLSWKGRLITAFYMKHLAPPEWLFGLLTVLGVALSARLVRALTSPAALLVVVILYFAGLTAVFNWAEDRFRVPVDGFFTLFAAVALVAAYEVVRKKMALRNRGIPAA